MSKFTPGTRATRNQVHMLAIVIIAGVLGGCGASPAPPNNDTNANDNGAASENVSFSAQIQPILTRSCAGCHSTGGAADLSGIEALLTEDVAYDRLVNQPSVQQSNLILVVPGEPNSSLLLDKVLPGTPQVGSRMPLFAPPLSEQEIDLIRIWIQEGARDN